ncbi:hypothetical protein SBI_02522 [Streptomyces bingchenggensis BCW-1]|uniref:Uncharacterized protein n=1 Tax=Streptomyces bingchenggensis (strain BCW-1) TaxID=749414 RepID=D7BYT4_STRBB|nr:MULTISPECIES: hypothetical protein [Streptomyces]ADI05643.1 hypothetical protein SBI_02522 [Streptomyces bingchenggensis BCW-1]
MADERAEVLSARSSANGIDPSASLAAAALLGFNSHLLDEPWFTPEEWEPRKVHVTHHADGVVTVVRVAYGYPDGRIDFHTTIGTSAGLHVFDERYDFTLHPEGAMVQAFQAAGFIEVRKEAVPKFRRGLWAARKP